jgi:F0F1-type ATP synthase assembly protein I
VLKGTLISLRIQSLTAVSLALLSLLAGPVAAYSSLFGSLAVLVPSLLFAVIVLRKLGGDSAAFLGTAVLAEFGKLVLTGLSRPRLEISDRYLNLAGLDIPSGWVR